MTLHEPYDGYVFGIGLGRTGSVSLGRALDIVGFRTEHFPKDGTKRELLDGAAQLTLFSNGYRALVDGIQPFFRDLDTNYPGSKFILTTRHVEGYVQSRVRLGRYIDELRRRTTPLRRAFLDHLEESSFGSVNPDAADIEKGFHRYHNAVREHFADREGDVLEMNLAAGDGWHKLCRFLGSPVPAGEFPRANSLGDLDDFADKSVALWNIIADQFPAGARVLVADNDALGLDFGRLGATPFPHRNGVNWGPPADSKCALEELEREAKADFFVLAWPCFWWMNFYKDFMAHLRERYQTLREDNVAIVFDCRSARSAS